MPFAKVLLILAFLCCLLASFGVGHPRVNLLALGLTCYFASLVFFP